MRGKLLDLQLLAGRSELLLGGLMVLAAAMMILPLPSLLVDGLLALNISVAVILLLLALQVGEALRVAVFPTLLLVTTLFRLSLNVSTTRLILLHGDAGAVVRAFGAFVVGGNPLVGGVVFLILTVVQFIVIAKGAERVAEVSARFCLDGMPGKQMSIDADLRAGIIDQQQAKRRRSELERESQFYGAMDGAMKFVKGDAVAGIVITLVNIGGGLLVGTLQQGLAAGEAVARYTVLTIGDGLVSQIPALLISTAAGLVVTRVRGGEQNEQVLGRQVMSQLRAHPQVPLMAGVVLCLLGLVPGMPTLAFGLLGVALLAFGLHLVGKAARADSAGGSAEPERTIRLLMPAAGQVQARERLPGLRAELEQQLGIAVPPIEVVSASTTGRWSMWLDGVPVAAGTVTGEQPLEQRLRQALLRLAPRLLGVQETQDLLDRLERRQPALVHEVVPRLVPPVLLAEILARLVEEGVAVTDLRGILAALAEWARVEADPAALAERVRCAQAPLITHLVAPQGRLEAWLLDPQIEQLVEAGLHRGEGGTTLALEPDQVQAVVAAVQQAWQRRPAGAVVTRPEVRRPLWRLLSHSLPEVRVVSFLELDPQTEIVPLGRIALSGTSGGGT